MSEILVSDKLRDINKNKPLMVTARDSDGVQLTFSDIDRESLSDARNRVPSSYLIK